jgi:hypothetical protein
VSFLELETAKESHHEPDDFLLNCPHLLDRVPLENVYSLSVDHGDDLLVEVDVILEEVGQQSLQHGEVAVPNS